MKHFIFLLLINFKATYSMDEGQLITNLNRNFTYKLTHTTCDRKLKKNQMVNLFQFLDLEKTTQDCHVLIQFQNFKEALEDEWSPSHPDMKALIALGKGTGILNADGTLKTAPVDDDADDIIKNQLARLLQLSVIANNKAQEETIFARILAGKTDEEIAREFLPTSHIFSLSTKRNVPHLQSLYRLAKAIQISSFKPPLSQKQKNCLEDISFDLLLNQVTNKASINETWMTLIHIILSRNPEAIKPVIKPLGESFSDCPSSMAIAAQQGISKIIQSFGKGPIGSSSPK